MEQSSDQPTGLSSAPSAKQEEPMVKQENITSERKYSNAATAIIRGECGAHGPIVQFSASKYTEAKY